MGETYAGVALLLPHLIYVEMLFAYFGSLQGFRNYQKLRINKKGGGKGNINELSEPERCSRCMVERRENVNDVN